MGDNRPIVYLEGKQVVYRASGVGKCIQALVAAGMGYEEYRRPETQEMLERTAEEGNLHEPHVVKTLEKGGYKFESRQELIEVTVIPGVIVRGHTDGWATGPEVGEGGTIEVKTMSRARFDKWLKVGLAGFPEYAVQLSVYMHDTSRPALYVVKRRDDGLLDLSVVASPPIPWKVIKKKVIEAEKWRARGELPSCGAEVDSAGKWFCPFPYLHGDDEEEELEDVEGEVVGQDKAERIFQLALDHQRLAVAAAPIRKQLTPLDEEKKAIGKELMGMGLPKKFTVNGLKVTRVDRTYPDVLWPAIAKALDTTVEEAKEKFLGVKMSSYVRVSGKAREGQE